MADASVSPVYAVCSRPVCLAEHLEGDLEQLPDIALVNFAAGVPLAHPEDHVCLGCTAVDEWVIGGLPGGVGYVVVLGVSVHEVVEVASVLLGPAGEFR